MSSSSREVPDSMDDGNPTNGSYCCTFNYSSLTKFLAPHKETSNSIIESRISIRTKETTEKFDSNQTRTLQSWNLNKSNCLGNHQ